MKINKRHIIFLIVLIGLLPFSIEANSLFTSFNSLFTEIDVEDTYDERDESFSSSKDSSSFESNSGGNALATPIQSLLQTFNFNSSAHTYTEEALLSKKVAYFILYCCLKLDC